MEKNKLADLYAETFQKNWDLLMFSDYEGADFKYRDIAQSIHVLKIIFEQAGIQKGDKIAIYGRNSANWAKIYLACLAYNAVVVPVLPDFKPVNVHHILNHSGTTFLFAAKSLYETLDPSQLTGLKASIAIEDFSVLYSSNDNFKGLVQNGLSMMKTDLVKRDENLFLPMADDQMLVLSYTSGSSGFSKGVMIPVRSIYSNIIFAQDHMPLKPGDKLVSFLPMSHVFGMLFEFLFPATMGCHTTFLNKMPSPPVLIQAFQKVKPNLILSVPLVIEKIYKKKLLPTLEKPVMKVLLSIPGIKKLLHKKIRGKLVDTFGGHFFELVIGGAALNAEVEAFFRKIKFPFTIGYGMTECGPLISYSSWYQFRSLSAGKLVDRLEVRIESEDPYHIVGEIQVRGDNVMLGYYNNDEANRNTFTEDGWLKTGDLGVIDSDNFIYIKGRSKNMLLGASGQNIYPEELETRLSNMPYVLECVVVQRENKLVALVYPDREALRAAGHSEEELEKLMAENRKKFNAEVPLYEQLFKIELVAEEFEKTPKRNIKRFLYS